MDKIVESILFVIITGLLFISEYNSAKFMKQHLEAKDSLKKIVLWGLAFRGSICCAAWLVRFPLYIFYILMLVSYFFNALLIYRRLNKNVIFWYCLRFLNFAFWHMLCMSACSMMFKQGLKKTYDTYYLQTFLCCKFFSLLALALEKRYKKKEFINMFTDIEKYSQLFFYGIFAVVYYMFDSLLFSFPLPYWQVVFLTFFSCILIEMQFHSFTKYTNEVLERSKAVEEYYKLEEKRAEQVRHVFVLQKLAYRDSMTGLYNRRYVKEMLDALQIDGKSITAAYIDVNGLKKVNDSLGHAAGDSYLLQVSKHINNCLDRTDVLARIGGDEFFVISTSMNQEEMQEVLSEANENLKKAIKQHPASFSFGVIEKRADEQIDMIQLLRESDKSMYEQKGLEKNKCVNS